MFQQARHLILQLEAVAARVRRLGVASHLLLLGQELIVHVVLIVPLGQEELAAQVTFIGSLFYLHTNTKWLLVKQRC